MIVKLHRHCEDRRFAAIQSRRCALDCFAWLRQARNDDVKP